MVKSSFHKVLVLVTTLACLPALANRTNPYCPKFREVQNYVRSLDGNDIHELFPEQDWTENRYQREDSLMNVTNIAKGVVLAMVGRSNWLAFAAIPTRAEAATVTGSYLRTPDDFARFLLLPPSQACSILTYPGREADSLRDLTHQLWIMVRRAKAR